MEKKSHAKRVLEGSFCPLILLNLLVMMMMVTTKEMQFCSIKHKYTPKHWRVYPVITVNPPASYRGVLKLSIWFKDIFKAHFT